MVLKHKNCEGEVFLTGFKKSENDPDLFEAKYHCAKCQDDFEEYNIDEITYE